MLMKNMSNYQRGDVKAGTDFFTGESYLRSGVYPIGWAGWGAEADDVFWGDHLRLSWWAMPTLRVASGF